MIRFHAVLSVKIKFSNKKITYTCYSTIFYLDSNLGILPLTRPFTLFAYYFCIARLS